MWSSTDGINWTLEIGDPDFSERGYHTLTSFNNHLFLIGGRSGNWRLNDVWRKDAIGVGWRKGYRATIERPQNYLKVLFNISR